MIGENSRYICRSAVKIDTFLDVLPELGVMDPGLSPGGACPEGYPDFHSTLMSPNSPVRVTVASHVPSSILETFRAKEAKPTCATYVSDGC